MGGYLWQKVKGLTSNSDIFIAISLLVILAVMIVPITPFMLDIFLTTILALSMVILLVSVYTKRPLEFSTFPSILLVMTLFRLSLNMASTRNILLGGASVGPNAAGEIVRLFGDLVVGGNFAVGLIIFIIFFIINFIVVTKGAGRVAEVAARFTLDAMPGKQMAIDADLNAGLIDEREAKRRRKEVAQEADFYGAMDGSSKFVRGDAIAGLFITFINIVGGIVIGMVQNSMSFSEASQIFALLTIGDGLVSQIPALVVSTAAGIIITRNTDEDSLGEQIAGQLRAHPKSLSIAACLLFALSWVGLPKLPFWSLALLLGWWAWRIERKSRALGLEREQRALEGKGGGGEDLEQLLPLDMCALEVGYGLIGVVDPQQDGDLLERIGNIRKQFALDWGVIIPSISICDNLELPPGGYAFKLRGIEVARGELNTGHLLAMDPGTVVEPVVGIKTTEPVFGLPALWVREEQKEDAQYNGYTVVDLSTIVATHLSEILKSSLHELFGRHELLRVLDIFRENYPKVVSDLIPDIMSLGTVLKVLQNLLREGVSVRDLRTILESLAEHGPTLKESNSLTELVRQALYRTITASIKSDQGDIALFTLDRSIEEKIAQNIVSGDQGVQVALDPKVAQSILACLKEKVAEATGLGEKMIVLCSPVIRYHFKMLTEKFIPNLIVVSHNELSGDSTIRSLGTVRL